MDIAVVFLRELCVESAPLVEITYNRTIFEEVIEQYAKL